ncbi:MAG: class I SAM-dependent methyltransferase [Patescibacteria group bacterium]
MKPDYAKYLIDKGRNDYNKIAQHFAETRYHLWPDFEIFRPYFKDGDTILDAGCGNGRLSEIFEKIKVNYIGIDSSERLIATARVKYPSLKFEVADILELIFPDGQFDVVFLIAVLQHVPSNELRLEAFKNIYRILKPDGHLLMTNWNLWQDIFRMNRLKNNLKKLLGFSQLDKNDIFKTWKSPQGEIIAERYLHAFNLPEIEELMSQAGFKVMKNFYSFKGRTVGQKEGRNIITIGQKID